MYTCSSKVIIIAVNLLSVHYKTPTTGFLPCRQTPHTLRLSQVDVCTCFPTDPSINLSQLLPTFITVFIPPRMEGEVCVCVGGEGETLNCSVRQVQIAVIQCDPSDSNFLCRCGSVFKLKKHQEPDERNQDGNLFLLLPGGYNSPVSSLPTLTDCSYYNRRFPGSGPNLQPPPPRYGCPVAGWRPLGWAGAGPGLGSSFSLPPRCLISPSISPSPRLV